jgi:beta-glucosidase
MGWRDVYEVYMAPFQAAIRDAGLGAIMNAYPELDGEVVAASRRILTEILRDELGFDGVVVSDYEAVKMIHNFHHVAPDLSTAARLALQAGIDVELPTVTCYGDALKSALESGEISIEIIDQAVSRHLAAKFELGLFEDPYVEEGGVLEVFETNQNRALAREIARQSIVLLKNDGSLPIEKTIKKIAVIGPNAHDGRNQLGDYSYAASKELLEQQRPPNSAFVNVNESALREHDIRIITVLEGIQAAVSAESAVSYVKGCDVSGEDRDGFDEAIAAAQDSDVVVLVLGDRSGLVPECTSGETRESADLRLPGVQEELARRIISTGKPVVVVLVNGRPYAIPWLADNVNAVIEAWLPGEEGGAAIADILLGDVNPGGKLPITFPRSAGQIPVFYNSKPAGLGSHWYGDYVDHKAAPLYPFGFGLSYTEFLFDDLVIGQEEASIGEQVDISLKVTNIGDVEGDEVVQLYTHHEYASVPRPVKELKGFTRLRLLPGECKMVTFHLPINQLAFFDNNLNLVIEPGRIFIMLGSSSDDIHLSSEFEISGSGVISIHERVFDCPVEIK